MSIPQPDTPAEEVDPEKSFLFTPPDYEVRFGKERGSLHNHFNRLEHKAWFPRLNVSLRTCLVVAGLAIFALHPESRVFIKHTSSYVISVPLLVGQSLGSSIRNCYFFLLGATMAVVGSGINIMIGGYHNWLTMISLIVVAFIGQQIIGFTPNILQMKIFIAFMGVWTASCYQKELGWTYLWEIYISFFPVYAFVICASLFPTPNTTSNHISIVCHRMVANQARVFYILNKGFITSTKDPRSNEVDEKTKHKLEKLASHFQVNLDINVSPMSPASQGDSEISEGLSNPKEHIEYAHYSANYCIEAQILINQVENDITEISSLLPNLDWESYIYRVFVSIFCCCMRSSGRSQRMLELPAYLLYIDPNMDKGVKVNNVFNRDMPDKTVPPMGSSRSFFLAPYSTGSVNIFLGSVSYQLSNLRGMLKSLTDISDMSLVNNQGALLHHIFRENLKDDMKKVSLQMRDQATNATHKNPYIEHCDSIFIEHFFNAKLLHIQDPYILKIGQHTLRFHHQGPLHNVFARVAFKMYRNKLEDKFHFLENTPGETMVPGCDCMCLTPYTHECVCISKLSAVPGSICAMYLDSYTFWRRYSLIRQDIFKLDQNSAMKLAGNANMSLQRVSSNHSLNQGYYNNGQLPALSAPYSQQASQQGKPINALGFTVDEVAILSHYMFCYDRFITNFSNTLTPLFLPYLYPFGNVNTTMPPDMVLPNDSSTELCTQKYKVVPDDLSVVAGRLHLSIQNTQMTSQNYNSLTKNPHSQSKLLKKSSSSGDFFATATRSSSYNTSIHATNHSNNNNHRVMPQFGHQSQDLFSTELANLATIPRTNTTHADAIVEESDVDEEDVMNTVVSISPATPAKPLTLSVVPPYDGMHNLNMHIHTDATMIPLPPHPDQLFLPTMSNNNLLPLSTLSIPNNDTLPTLSIPNNNTLPIVTMTNDNTMTNSNTIPIATMHTLQIPSQIPSPVPTNSIPSHTLPSTLHVTPITLAPHIMNPIASVPIIAQHPVVNEEEESKTSRLRVDDVVISVSEPAPIPSYYIPDAYVFDVFTPFFLQKIWNCVSHQINPVPNVKQNSMKIDPATGRVVANLSAPVPQDEDLGIHTSAPYTDSMRLRWIHMWNTEFGISPFIAKALKIATKRVIALGLASTIVFLDVGLRTGERQWAVLTAGLQLHNNTGSTLHVVKERLTGTTLGAFLGYFVVVGRRAVVSPEKHVDWLEILLAALFLAIACFPLAFQKHHFKGNYTCMVAMVTLLLIGTSKTDTEYLLLQRVMMTMYGAFCVTLTSLLMWPSSGVNAVLIQMNEVMKEAFTILDLNFNMLQMALFHGSGMSHKLYGPSLLPAASTVSVLEYTDPVTHQKTVYGSYSDLQAELKNHIAGHNKEKKIRYSTAPGVFSKNSVVRLMFQAKFPNVNLSPMEGACMQIYQKQMINTLRLLRSKLYATQSLVDDAKHENNVYAELLTNVLHHQSHLLRVVSRMNECLGLQQILIDKMPKVTAIDRAIKRTFYKSSTHLTRSSSHHSASGDVVVDEIQLTRRLSAEFHVFYSLVSENLRSLILMLNERITSTTVETTYSLPFSCFNRRRWTKKQDTKKWSAIIVSYISCYNKKLRVNAKDDYSVAADDELEQLRYQSAEEAKSELQLFSMTNKAKRDIPHWKEERAVIHQVVLAQAKLMDTYMHVCKLRIARTAANEAAMLPSLFLVIEQAFITAVKSLTTCLTQLGQSIHALNFVDIGH